MGARLPQDDDVSDSEATEFGIAALAARLEEADVSYPVTADELREILGDPSIPIDVHGRTVRLSTVLADADTRRFDSERELLNALHPVFEEKREAAVGGVFGSIRSLLPF